jgi:hypothetical protein
MYGLRLHQFRASKTDLPSQALHADLQGWTQFLFFSFILLNFGYSNYFGCSDTEFTAFSPKEFKIVRDAVNQNPEYYLEEFREPVKAK